MLSTLELVLILVAAVEGIVIILVSCLCTRPKYLHKEDTMYHIGEMVKVKKVYSDSTYIGTISDIVFDDTGVRYRFEETCTSAIAPEEGDNAGGIWDEIEYRLIPLPH